MVSFKAFSLVFPVSVPTYTKGLGFEITHISGVGGDDKLNKVKNQDRSYASRFNILVWSGLWSKVTTLCQNRTNLKCKAFFFPDDVTIIIGFATADVFSFYLHVPLKVAYTHDSIDVKFIDSINNCPNKKRNLYWCLSILESLLYTVKYAR